MILLTIAGKKDTKIQRFHIRRHNFINLLVKNYRNLSC